MSKTAINVDITGSVPVKSVVLRLALPLSFIILLQAGYQLINLLWVSRLGPLAVVALSVCFPAVMVLSTLGTSLAMGGGILMSQAVGAKNTCLMQQYARGAAFVSIAFALLIMAIALPGANAVLALFKVEGAVHRDALTYLWIFLLGLPATYCYSVLHSVLRSIGDMKSFVKVMVISLVLTAILDPLLIFGVGPFPALGVAGAAYATVLAQAAGLIIINFLFTRDAMINPRLDRLRVPWLLMRRIVILSVPAATEQLIQLFGIFLINILCAQFGEISIGAYGLCLRLIFFVNIPSIAVSSALQIIIGQNIGADNMSRARAALRFGTTMTFLLLATLGLVVFVCAYPIAAVFSDGDAAFADSCAVAIRICALSFAFTGAQYAMRAAFMAAARVTRFIWFMFVNILVLQVPMAYILAVPAGLGIDGVWYAIPLSSALSAAYVYWNVVRRTWERPKVETTDVGQRGREADAEAA